MLGNVFFEAAESRLQSEIGEVKGQKEKVMSSAVMKALLDFCRQSQEFAKAVVEGKSFVDCMTAVGKGVGNSISDLDAYKKAVKFYFPTAEVEMQLSINLQNCQQTAKKPAGIVLNLRDYV